MFQLLYKIPFIIFLSISIFFSHPSLIIAATQQSHPLRPFPFDLTTEEQGRGKESAEMTLYCTQRPVAVQTNEIDKRDKKITVEVRGQLTSDLSEFITPLLSITDSSKEDFDRNFEEKAQRYLADYLGGRAFYESFAESAENQEFLKELERSQVLTDQELSLIKTYGLNNIPDEDQKQFIKTKINSGFTMSRFGVFRKLAPKTYQDKLKRAMIQRAAGTFTDDYYGFQPASQSVHNYIVGYWDNAENKVADYGKGQEITLKDFIDNWAPIPETFAENPEQYLPTYEQWTLLDNGKWAQLWPYVPMFSREDTKGYVTSITEPNQSNSGGDINEVIHPHLARTYELTSALHNLLTPEELHSTNYSLSPKLESQWNNPPWTTRSQWEVNGYIDWWFDSSKNQSQWTNPEIHGPVCDPTSTIIYSSGDLAQDSSFQTNTKFIEENFNNPFYEEPFTNDCGYEEYPCQEFTYLEASDSATTSTDSCTVANINNKKCFVNKDVLANPNYLLTYTPFLNNIMNRLVTGKASLFNIFKTASEIEQEPPENWPAVGADSTNPTYIFDAGSAQAGFKKSANPAQFYYKYLGWIHCQKQKLITKLQPSAGQEYSLSPECGGEPDEIDDPDSPEIPEAPTECTSEKLKLTFENTSTNPIAQRAWEIVSDLYQGFWCYWNRSPKHFDSDTIDYPPSYPYRFDKDLYIKNPLLTNYDWLANPVNMFWCTYLVNVVYKDQDSDFPFIGRADVQAAHFKDNPNYTLYEGESLNISSASPGDAIFFEVENTATSGRINHVAIIYAVIPSGIITVESNAAYKTLFYPVNQDGTFQKVNEEINVKAIGSSN